MRYLKNLKKSENRKLFQSEYKEIIKFHKEDYLKMLSSINNVIINKHEYFVQNRIHIPSKGKYKLEDYIVKKIHFVL